MSKRFLLGTVVLAVVLLSSGPALAAQPRAVMQKVAWQREIAQFRTPGPGCYSAMYPALQWHATRCAVAPKLPLAPAVGYKSAAASHPVDRR